MGQETILMFYFDILFIHSGKLSATRNIINGFILGQFVHSPIFPFDSRLWKGQFGNGKGMEKIHSQSSGTGREWKKSIPKIREREGNEKNPFPKFGNGKGMKKSIPKVRERESEASILGNDREREFPLTPGVEAFAWRR